MIQRVGYADRNMCGLCEPLDDAEKRRSEAIVFRYSAWVPVTHASVAPLHDVFQTDAFRVARRFAPTTHAPVCSGARAA